MALADALTAGRRDGNVLVPYVGLVLSDLGRDACSEIPAGSAEKAAGVQPLDELALEAQRVDEIVDDGPEGMDASHGGRNLAVKTAAPVREVADDGTVRAANTRDVLLSIP